MVAAFDVETRNLGGELLSVQWGIMGNVQYRSGPTKMREFIDTMLQYPKPVVWYGHFAQYDWRYMLNLFVEMGLVFEICMRTDNDVYEIRIETPHGRVVMRDSYAIFNSPLEKLADSFCPEIPKLKIDIENFDPENPEHIEYAKRDVLILLVGLPRLFALLRQHFDVSPAGTFAGTSMKGWQKTLPKETSYQGSKFDAQELFIRQGYYGGLVFLTTNQTQTNCETYDLNSCYPYVMMEHGVPDGRTFESDDYLSGKMGMYHVRVKTPDDLIVPILPARNERGNMRWMRGEFETVVTNQELIFAAKHGYEIIDIISGLVFEETVFPFNDLIGHCRDIRKQFKGGPEEILAKYMQNSLYGKFGSRRERLRVIPSHCLTDEDYECLIPYDDEGLWYVKKEIDEEMRCKPEWSAFITAHARLRLLQAVYSIGPENVYYGDTDSITVRSGSAKGIDVGNEYGQWKLEKEWAEFRPIAPKVYSGVLKDGRRMGAAKGLPRKGITDEHWKDLLEKGFTSAQAMSLPSLRASLKKGMKPAEILLRRSSTLENSSNYFSLPDGRVRVKFRA
jgi:hypothetical protein